MSKKFFALLLAVLLVVGALPMAAAAATSGTVGGLNWRVTADNELVISGNGPIPDFDDYVSTPWSDCGFTQGKGAPAKAIIIEPGVTSIGENAFSFIGCMSLSIPDTVTSIGASAFSYSGCGDGTNTQPMESVNIPGSVKEIGYGAFQFFGAKTFILNEGTTTLGGRVFFQHNSMENIYIPSSLTTCVGEELGYTMSLKNIYYAGSEADFKAKNLADEEMLGFFTEALIDNQVLPTVHYNTPAPGSTPVTPPTPPTPTVGGFNDVFEGEYYADPVVWAVQNSITSGLTATTFGPTNTCTRAQIVTFLWRAKGSPKPTTTATFSDVPAGEYYADAVSWAVENNITSGVGNGKFNPGGQCTRAQAVTFLWRAAGEPTGTGSSFGDVPSGEYYADAVKWAVGKNITSGTTTATFSPDNICQRGQIVTFLYRAK